MNYTDAVNFIEKSTARGSILGLDRISRLCEILGNPQEAFEVIHIAGTNGKGSTCAFISSILTEAGYRTGMYYSPALTGIRDHYMIDGELISEEDYALCVGEVAKANELLEESLGEGATSFELETVIAFVYFRLKNCRFAVVETGLGGRDDATNVIRNEKLCVFASISLDHMSILGESIYEIAKVKAGIITSNCPVVAFDSDDDAVLAISQECSVRNNRLSLVRKEDISSTISENGKYLISYKEHKDVEISLHGTFQTSNGALALAAIDALINEGIDISEDAIRLGMRNAYWPFRFEKISSEPDIYLDGAHNKDAADKLACTIETELNNKKIILVMGMFKDKDYEYVIGRLAPFACQIITLTVPDVNRALDAKIISRIGLKYCEKVTSSSSIEEAVDLSIRAAGKVSCQDEEGVILACGSLSYLSIFKDGVKAFYGQS